MIPHSRPALSDGGAVSQNRLDDFVKWRPEQWQQMAEQALPTIRAHARDAAEVDMFAAMLMEVES